MTNEAPSAIDQASIEPPTSQNMKVWGWVVALSGMGLMVWAFTMNVAVTAEAGPYGLSSDVINIGLLSNREMVLTAGAAFLISGVVLVAAGHIRKGLEVLAAK